MAQHLIVTHFVLKMCGLISVERYGALCLGDIKQAARMSLLHIDTAQYTLFAILLLLYHW